MKNLGSAIKSRGYGVPIDQEDHFSVENFIKRKYTLALLQSLNVCDMFMQDDNLIIISSLQI